MFAFPWTQCSHGEGLRSSADSCAVISRQPIDTKQIAASNRLAASQAALQVSLSREESQFLEAGFVKVLDDHAHLAMYDQDLHTDHCWQFEGLAVPTVKDVRMPTVSVKTGLTRFDISERKIRGYMVRITRQRKSYQEFFSDKRCGGKRKAKQLAAQRYDELVAELPDKIQPKGLMSVRNTSGKVGVHVAYDIDRRWPGCEYWSYCASWLDETKRRRNVRFSWNKYGEDVAWGLACVARDNELTDRERILEIHKQQQRKSRRKRKPR